MAPVSFCSRDFSPVGHLFNPWCPDLSTIKKVCIVVFHILTLGIPLLLYALSGGYARIRRQQEYYQNQLNAEAVQRSQIAKEALLHAQDQLRNPSNDLAPGLKNPNITTARNKELLHLNDLVTEANQALYGALFQIRRENILGPEFLQIAQTSVQLAYALSYLYLQDLKINHVNPFDNIASDAIENVYAHSPLFYFARVYSLVKNLGPNADANKSPPPEYTKRFYEGGDLEPWRLLYNEFCTSVHEFLDELTLIQNLIEAPAEANYRVWIPLDEDAETFKPHLE